MRSYFNAQRMLALFSARVVILSHIPDEFSSASTDANWRVRANIYTCSYLCNHPRTFAIVSMPSCLPARAWSNQTRLNNSCDREFVAPQFTLFYFPVPATHLRSSVLHGKESLSIYYGLLWCLKPFYRLAVRYDLSFVACITNALTTPIEFEFLNAPFSRVFLFSGELW